VYSECQLSEIIRPDRNSIEQLCKSIDLDHVIWDFAHNIDFQTIISFEPIVCHSLDNPARLLNAPTERNHDDEIRQSHVFAHPTERGTFESKTVCVCRVGVAR